MISELSVKKWKSVRNAVFSGFMPVFAHTAEKEKWKSVRKDSKTGWRCGDWED